MATIAVIGLGNLGSALAKLLLDNGHKVLAFEHDAQVVDAVNHERCNPVFLPNVQFKEGITASGDLQKVLANADIIFNCLPSRFTLATFQQGLSSIKNTAHIINMAKGVNAVGLTVVEQLQRLLPHHEIHMLSGPSIANEFAVGKLTAITFASSDKVLQQQIVGLLSNAHFAVQLSDDVLAVELGGILKNIYAFGLGLLKGIEAPKLNFIGAYFTVALDEMQHFMRAKTANAAAILALSGVGDLITTALSDDSHNVQLGKKLAFGEKIENLQDGKLLPEGINTLEVFLKQAEHLDVEMPLAELIKRLAYKQISLEAWQKEFVLLLQK